VVIDADGQHLPEELPRLLAPILRDQADIVIGSRYIDDTSNTPIDRRLGHKLINLATSVPSGIYVSDSQSGFRLFRPAPST
jgi:glycosyltransferase involved in cell wall biosynthesis